MVALHENSGHHTKVVKIQPLRTLNTTCAKHHGNPSDSCQDRNVNLMVGGLLAVSFRR